MEKSSQHPLENNTKVTKSAKSKLSALRRGLKIDKSSSSKNKEDKKVDKKTEKGGKAEKAEKPVKPNKTYSLIKKLKLGKSVSNPTLGSPQAYLASEIAVETVEKTTSLSSMSTDAASTSGNIRVPDSDMSNSAAESNPRSTENEAVASVASVASPSPTLPPEEEEDSYESFHESENAQHSENNQSNQVSALSTDKYSVKPSSSTEPEGSTGEACENSAKVTAEMPAFSDLIFDKQQENAQTVMFLILYFCFARFITPVYLK